MKKALHILSSAAVALAALTSCAKEQLIENVLPAGEAIQVSINGLIGELTPADATKATAGSVVRVTWETGDKVYVYDGTACIGTLTVTPDTKNASYALLSGTIKASTASTAPTKLTLVYVKGATEAPTIAGGKISIDLSTQDQAEVPFVLYTTVDYDKDALTKTNEYISFSFATSVMTVNCTGLQTGAEDAVTKAEIRGVSTVCELTVTGDGVTVSGASKGTITRSETATPSVFTQSDSRGSFRLAIAADPAAPAARNILVYQGSKVSGAPFASTTLVCGQSYNTVYQLSEYISTGAFTVAEGKQVYFSPGNLWYDGSAFYFETNQYDYTPTSNGYARVPTHISHFFWSKDARVAYSDAYSDASAKANDVLFTNTTVTTANPEFTVNGIAGKYRALSTEEWTYLLNTRSVNGGTGSGKSYQIATINSDAASVKGLILYPDDFTGTAKSSYTKDEWVSLELEGAVFLPAAGVRSNIIVNDVGNYVQTWSSSAKENGTALAVHSGTQLTPNQSTARQYGCSVRLVTEAPGYAVVKVTGVSLNKDKATLVAGGATETLVATVAPAGAANKTVNWSSSDETIASVDEYGKVTGKSKGSAVITATTEDGNFKDFCLVTVKQLPKGALFGEFSVGDNKKVYFSNGNLWYGKVGDAQTATFNFESNQYYYQSSLDYSHISRFFWSKDASVAYANSYNDAGANANDVLFTNATETTANPEFTVNDEKGKYRTLSSEEWRYLLNDGNAIRKDKYKVNVTVCGKGKCIVLLPDNWEWGGDYGANWVNNYSEDTWKKMEAAGAVCLPPAGMRLSTSLAAVGEYGYYLMSSRSSGNPYVVKTSNTKPEFTTVQPGNASSIRLVTDVPAE